MKKWFFLLLSLPFVFGACKKDKKAGCTAVQTTNVATAAEIDSLQHYVDIHGLPAIKHECGAFYTIDSAGTTGLNTGICSAIAVKYSGYLLGNTTAFDERLDSAGVVFTLTDLVVGWQRMMPLIKAGGGITLYIPPSLGYGSVDKKDPNGDIIVPKNSYMKFNISLLQVY